MAEVRVETRREVIEKVLDIAAAYLYGSYAAGTAYEDSDTDVAIISADLSGDRLEDWCRLNKVSRQIDVRMEVIGFRPERFRGEDPLAWEVRTKGIRLL